ncbi:ATP/GTP-binding protein [Streptomyces sp. YC504]|uniref:ATP/GTP-binding protein n=2 Tax=Streptomyces mesophilus TaxID=1775132 RepID=A0A6G4XED7_9ACTN|nr:ATP/GTP-binding protein [Streptomyces mesophilus]
MEPQPPATHRAWKGHKPGDGAIYVRSCGKSSFGDPGAVDADMFADAFWAAAAPPAVDPAILALQAVSKMKLAGPNIASPRADGQYGVKVPMWLWVNAGPNTFGPITTSATAGAVTVTATAKVASITWDLGNGGKSVTCNSAGTPYKASYGMAKSPRCGTVFTEASTEEPGGTFTITATSTWNVDWQVVGGGATGQLTELFDTQVPVTVVESQAIN